MSERFPKKYAPGQEPKKVTPQVYEGSKVTFTFDGKKIDGAVLDGTVTIDAIAKRLATPGRHVTVHLSQHERKDPFICQSKKAAIVFISVAPKRRADHNPIQIQYPLPLGIEYGDSIQLHDSGDLTVQRDMFTKPLFLAYGVGFARVTLDIIEP
jgi:hypothetical protein